MNSVLQWLLEWLEVPYSTYSTDAFTWKDIFITHHCTLCLLFSLYYCQALFALHGCNCDWRHKPVISIHCHYFCSPRLKNISVTNKSRCTKTHISSGVWHSIAALWSTPDPIGISQVTSSTLRPSGIFAHEKDSVTATLEKWPQAIW